MFYHIIEGTVSVGKEKFLGVILWARKLKEGPEVPAHREYCIPVTIEGNSITFHLDRITGKSDSAELLLGKHLESTPTCLITKELTDVTFTKPRGNASQQNYMVVDIGQELTSKISYFRDEPEIFDTKRITEFVEEQSTKPAIFGNS